MDQTQTTSRDRRHLRHLRRPVGIVVALLALAAPLMILDSTASAAPAYTCATDRSGSTWTHKDGVAKVSFDATMKVCGTGTGQDWTLTMTTTASDTKCDARSARVRVYSVRTGNELALGFTNSNGCGTSRTVTKTVGALNTPRIEVCLRAENSGGGSRTDCRTHTVQW